MANMKSSEIGLKVGLKITQNLPQISQVGEHHHIGDVSHNFSKILNRPFFEIGFDVLHSSVDHNRVEGQQSADIVTSHDVNVDPRDFYQFNEIEVHPRCCDLIEVFDFLLEVEIVFPQDWVVGVD
jgi:hypothetical protein